MGLPCLTNGLYSFSITFIALSLLVPKTTRSGFIKSETANPSLRNSGLETTANSILALLEMAAFTFSAVPTGTVLLSTITLNSVMIFPSSSATPSMYERSADPSSPGGVGKARNMISASLIPSSKEVVNFNRPAAIFLSKYVSRLGS